MMKIFSPSLGSWPRSAESTRFCGNQLRGQLESHWDWHQSADRHHQVSFWCRGALHAEETGQWALGLVLLPWWSFKIFPLTWPLLWPAPIPGISFTPHEVGAHLVNVYRHGEHIPNSPFKIFVGETEIGNASKVKVYGRGISEGMANEINEFFVNTKDAGGSNSKWLFSNVNGWALTLTFLTSGYGGLSLSIEGPSKADIECHDNEDGSCRVTYKPTEPGTYIVNVKFADEHVPGESWILEYSFLSVKPFIECLTLFLFPGSPFMVKIGGEPSGRITERITRQSQAADITHVGSQCELSLKIPGLY